MTFPVDVNPGAPSQVHEILCGLFADLLEIPRVTADTDFFAAGGQSLLAARLVRRIRRVLGGSLEIRDVFEAPTPAGLEAKLTTGRRPIPDVRAGGSGGRAKIAGVQRRLWFLNRFDPSAPTYVVPVDLRLRGPVDHGALADAVGDVVHRHESLRTVFPDRGGIPEPVVVPWPGGWSPPAVVVVDRVEDALRAELDAHSRMPFDLTTDLPIRARLMRIGPTDLVLSLRIHHIAFDGWSLRPFVRDLALAYLARATGRAPEWDLASPSYADYAEWHAELLGPPEAPGSLEADQLGFWTAALADLPEDVAVVWDRPRPLVAQRPAGTVALVADGDLPIRLTALARTTRSTMFTVLRCGVAALLTRLGAGCDIPLGTAVHGRSDDRFDDVVGMFVNTIVLRTDTAGNPRFRDLVTRARETDVAAHANQDVPFDRVVDALNPVRSGSPSPLFQVYVGLAEETLDAVTELGSRLGVDAELIETAPPRASFDLKVDFGLNATGALSLRLTYDEDVYDETTIQRLATRLIALLDQVALNPDIRLSDIDVFDEAERRSFHEWNDTEKALDPATLPRLFSEQAARIPGATAVRFESRSMTYAELDTQATRLARALLARGAGPGTVVAVAMPRSAELIVALHGVHKAGAAYLPVDPDHPPERVAWTLQDAQPYLTLTEETFAELVSSGPMAPGPLPIVRPEWTAYVIYTSGSTGRPKGVVVNHAAIANRLRWVQATFPLDGTDRLLQKTPMSFDVSVPEFFWPLIAGATLVVAQPGGHRDPEYLTRVIEQERITIVHFVPSMLEEFLRHGEAGACTSLRRLLCSGEALPTALVREWAGLNAAQVVNLYGPTEAAVDVTFHVADANDPGPVVPLGTPVWNTKAYVLNDDLNPVPAGVPGSLYLAGAQLAAGYLGRPDLTSARFVADPFGPPGTRMYRTGDVARQRPDGVLEYLGRDDDQVKIRGVRVEPEEARNALLRQPGVRAAAVVARTSESETRLIAYVVADATEPDPVELRRSLRHELLEHLVPSVIVSVPELPLTPSGKLDRAALPDPVHELREPQAPPRTAAERKLCLLFAQMLGHPEVGIDDNFFDLGGHSLLVPRLVHAAREQGIPLSVRSLFEAPTIRALSELGPVGPGHTSLRPVLRVRDRASGDPLFCLYPAAGVGWGFAGLRAHLSSDVPIYSLQAPGLTDPSRTVATMEAQIADVVARIRDTRPDEPYHLCGWSFGAVLAHGVACALHREGSIVRSLVLLDGYPGSHSPALTAEETRAALLASLGYDLGPDRSTRVGRSEFDEIIATEPGLLQGIDASTADAVIRVFGTNRDLLRGHEPSHYPGDAVLVVAGSDVDPARPAPNSWAPYIGGELDVRTVAASHGTMTRPGPLAEIAAVLAEKMEVSPDEPNKDVVRHRGRRSVGILTAPTTWSHVTGKPT